MLQDDINDTIIGLCKGWVPFFLSHETEFKVLKNTFMKEYGKMRVSSDKT